MRTRILIFTLTAIITASCGTPPNATNQSAVEVPSPAATTAPTAIRTDPNLPDFRNFEFPICFKSLPEIAPKLKSIRLADGELTLNQGDYGLTDQMIIFNLENVSSKDLTGDGHDEALVTIQIQYFQGHETAILLFDLSGKKPRLIWTREFGDAAFGGLRKIEFTDDGLITEEYSSARARNHPTSFTRKRYQLKSGKVSEIESVKTEADLDHVEFLGFPSPNK